MAAFADYRDRMVRVIDHIDRHLDEDLSLDRLAAVAAFSKHHFHRQFAALFGLPVHRYVQLARLKRASYRLAFRSWQSVTDIALDAGYDTPEGFARAFRRRIGQGPAEFRKAPDWQPWQAALAPLTESKTMIAQQFALTDVEVVDRPAVPVLFMRHQGDPALLGDTIRRFIAWRREAGLRAATHATYTLFHTDPEVTDPGDYRIDLCVATSRAPDGEGIAAGVIPAGRAARLRIVGNSDDLRPAASFLYGVWLPDSGEEAGDFPLFAERVRFFPDVPEHEAITDLYLPLR